MIKEFKEFISKGNLVHLAVAFIMGVTFAAVVTSLVNDIIMPAVGRALGGLDFASFFAVIKQGDPAGPYNTVEAAAEAGAVTINYGLFVNSVIVFIIVALVLFFIVKAYNKTTREDEEEAPETKECPFCHTDIPVAAVRCPNCTSELPAVAGEGS